jgi:hypothetical protein
MAVIFRRLGLLVPVLLLWIAGCAGQERDAADLLPGAAGPALLVYFSDN